MNPINVMTAAALAVIAFSSPVFAQDAMAPAAPAPAADAMAADAMAPAMSDEDLALCLEQAGVITFAHVRQAAEDACHGGHGAPGDAMAPDAMAPDAMAPAMAPDAMAPVQ